MCSPMIEKYGANPAHVQWTVVRGDTAFLQVQFYEADETTGKPVIAGYKKKKNVANGGIVKAFKNF